MRFFTSCCKVRCLRLSVGGSEAPAPSLLTARLRGVYLRILWTFSTHSGPRTNPDNAGESKCKGQDTAGTGRPAGGQWYYRPINSVRLYHSWLHISIRRPYRNPSSGPVRLEGFFSFSVHTFLSPYMFLVTPPLSVMCHCLRHSHHLQLFTPWWSPRDLRKTYTCGYSLLCLTFTNKSATVMDSRWSEACTVEWAGDKSIWPRSNHTEARIEIIWWKLLLLLFTIAYLLFWVNVISPSVYYVKCLQWEL